MNNDTQLNDDIAEGSIDHRALLDSLTINSLLVDQLYVEENTKMTCRSHFHRQHFMFLCTDQDTIGPHIPFRKLSQHVSCMLPFHAVLSMFEFLYPLYTQTTPSHHPHHSHQFYLHPTDPLRVLSSPRIKHAQRSVNQGAWLGQAGRV